MIQFLNITLQLRVHVFSTRAGDSRVGTCFISTLRIRLLVYQNKLLPPIRLVKCDEQKVEFVNQSEIQIKFQLLKKSHRERKKTDT